MKHFPSKTSTNTLYEPTATLSELANKFETDKGTADPTTLSWHTKYPKHRCMHYTKTYERYMCDYRYSPVNMLEIGVCDNRFPFASVKMWMSYFQQPNFYAMDNFWGHRLEDRQDDVETLNDMGVSFVYADQGNFDDWDSLNFILPFKFDFVVEDGSHWPNHMMISLWKSRGLVQHGGYYFIEDIQNPLKSRGWFKYDNSLVASELLETLSTGKLYSSFLNDTQNAEVDDSFELVEMVLDPDRINYLAVLRRK